MIDYLSQFSNLKLFLILALIFTITSIMCILIITHWLPRRARPEDNAVIGSISSIVGVIYGVLVGLTALYLFNNISSTADAVRHEANAVANIYRASFWLSSDIQKTVKKNLTQYLNHVLNVEWSLMNRGKVINAEGETAINEIAHSLKSYSLNAKVEKLAFTSILNNIEELFDARNERIEMSHSELNPAVWIVVIIGSVLTLAINYFFIINYYLHFLSVAAIGLMVSSMLFLLVALDRPFQGEFSVASTPFKSVLNFINK